jgi:methylase of polypeptide subunit release factors
MEREDALVELLAQLKQRDYRFITVTPATHARVLARRYHGVPGLRDVFGWNRLFEAADLEPDLLDLMRQAGVVESDGGGLRSSVRVSSLGADLFLHSAYPTDEEDAVFFGPDTYRFAAFVARHVPVSGARHIVDLGAGSGAGGIAAACLSPAAAISLVDTNPAALELARVNARAARVTADLVQGAQVPDGVDMVMANPPYMMDEGSRTYRDGGSLLGGEVALEWAGDALAKLASGGTMLLYTGVAMEAGVSPLLAELGKLCADAGATLSVEELDPDVFGEELDRPAYAQVERIAAVGAVIRKA